MSDLHTVQLELVEQMVGLLVLSCEQLNNHHLTFAIMVLVKEKLDMACVSAAKAIGTPEVEEMANANSIIEQYLEISRL